MEKIIFTQDASRIDKFLSIKFGYSRSFFHHIIQRNTVSVNWKFVKKSYILKKNDIVEVDSIERYNSIKIFDEAPKIDLPIKLSKQDYIVLYKPKWVLSHPNSIWDIWTPSVVWFLYHKYKDLPNIGNFIRAGLIHRLDKDTDWLMIVAKTEKWLAYFKSLFEKKSLAKSIEEKEKIPLKKFYSAIVSPTQNWKFFIKKIESALPYYIVEPVKPKIPYYKDYKIWITKVLQIQKKWDQFQFDLEILTWRTHQIRYHLSKNWLPILWDYLYWKSDDTSMQLTAYKLQFTDIDNEQVSISI